MTHQPSSPATEYSPEVFLFYRHGQLHHIHTDRKVFEDWIEKSPWQYPPGQCEIVRYVPATPTGGEWDKGEHEGCGIDSQRALERHSRLSAGSAAALALADEMAKWEYPKNPRGADDCLHQCAFSEYERDTLVRAIRGAAQTKRETCIDCGKIDPCDDDCPNFIEPPQAAPMEAALRDILSWKEDVLGDRSKLPGPYACAPEITEAFDRGARMAFYRCALRASEALSPVTSTEGK